MIGVFDSGYGGLTIFKEIFKKLPDYNYIYLGDNFRSPYGNRSQEAIYKFTHQAVEYLFKQSCELVILACNTASAEALRNLQQNYLLEHHPERRILGVIRPMAEAAAKITVNKRVGVVGTRATIESESFIKELQKQNSTIKVFQQTCPLLVPLIEEGWAKKIETRMILKKYLRKLKSFQIDTLILGCTHYVLLLDDFRRIMGKRATVPKPAEVVAESLEDYLKRHSELEKKLSKQGQVTYLTTNSPERFDRQAEIILNQKVKSRKIIF